MNDFGRKNLLLTFLVTFCCFAFTWFYFGFYYVEYEALFDSFYSGKLTPGLSFPSIYFLAHIGTSHIYSLLYQSFPGVEWLSCILYSYQFISCFLCLYIIADLLPQSLPWWLKALAQITVYLLVFADQNIHFLFTRVSYMATGFSLIALLYFFRLPGSIKQRPVLFIALNLWFIIGTLTRSESAAAIFVQIAVFGIIYLQNLKRFVALFLFPACFLFSVLAAIAYDIKTSKDFYKQVEPDIEAQFCERENIVPLSTMQTYRDSVLWMTAKNIMWSDPQIITPVYMRSLIKPEKLIFTDPYHWKRVYNYLSEILMRFWYLVLICILLSLMLFFYSPTSSLQGVFSYLVFVSSFWILIVMQTYVSKVYDRCFTPPISLFIYCYIILLLPLWPGKILRGRYMAIISTIFLFAIHCCQLKAESNQLKSDLNDYRENTEAITSIANDKILVVNSSSCDYLFSCNKPFHPFDFRAFKKLYITDGYNMPFLPYYRRYLEKECSCNMLAFPSFWDYLRTKHEEVVVVSTAQRMDILTSYLKTIHHYDLPVTASSNARLLQLEKSDRRGIFVNLKVYDLGS